MSLIIKDCVSQLSYQLVSVASGKGKTDAKK